MCSLHAAECAHVDVKEKRNIKRQNELLTNSRLAVASAGTKACSHNIGKAEFQKS